MEIAKVILEFVKALGTPQKQIYIADLNLHMSGMSSTPPRIAGVFQRPDKCGVNGVAARLGASPSIML